MEELLVVIVIYAMMELMMIIWSYYVSLQLKEYHSNCEVKRWILLKVLNNDKRNSNI